MRTPWSRADVVGLGATVASVLVALLVALWSDGGWFFRGDTQAAYYGWWFHVGEQLRDGQFPVIDAQSWRAGNFAAEGQWGIFSPAVWLLGLLATVVPSVIGLATGVKFAVACFGAAGSFVLARSYGAHPAAAYVAGLASALGGMSVWLEWPSWVAGLTIWALAPWAWWAVRRTALRGANPFPALLFCYLLVTTGYVYGTLMLGVVLAALVVETLANRRGLWAVVGVAAFALLVAVAVYLPGWLTMDVTIRADPSYTSDPNRLTTNPLDVLTSFLPSAGAEGGFEQQTAWRYVGWFVPIFVLVRWRAVRRDWRLLAAPLVAAAAAFVIVNGPGVLGPLRWPMRLQPFLVQFVAVLLAALLTRRRMAVSPARAAVALSWIGAATAWYAWRDTESSQEHLIGGAVVAGAFLALAWLVRRGPWIAAVTAAGVSLGVLVLQLAWWPEPPSDQRNMPHSLSGYSTQLSSAAGDVFVVGQQDDRVIDDPLFPREVLNGSLWYLNEHPVQNTYTTISFHEYYDRYCMRIHGQTCPEAVATLFSTEPVTGRLRVDLLSVSTLLLIKADVGSPPVPAGWHVSDETARTVTWVRDEPLPTAGGPVWASPGVSVSEVRSSDREVSFRVSSASSGGRVVLSRLAWPGYRTSYGGLAEPADGYLLTVDLPPEASGRTVTVHFDPPGWPVELACLGLAVACGLVWSVVAWTRSVRCRRQVT